MVDTLHPEKRLIVNADDYGATLEVSRGILQAHHKGIVTATAVMITSTGVIAGIQDAIATAPQLGLGLHLTLSGKGIRPMLPAEQVPSLVQPDGTFYPFDQWFAHYEGFNPDEIARELRAQCACFLDIAERPPDHLDSHHHAVYRHPAALRTLFDLAAEYRLPVRNVGFGGETTESSLHWLLEGLSPELQESSRATLKNILDVPLPPWPQRFEGSFYDNTSTRGELLLILTNLPQGVTELMCHPGYADEALVSDYTTKREEEIAALTHSSTSEVIKAEGITLVRSDSIPTAPSSPTTQA